MNTVGINSVTLWKMALSIRKESMEKATQEYNSYIAEIRNKIMKDLFTKAYITCALCLSTDDNDEPLDKNYDQNDIPYCVVQFFISPKPYLKEARILEQRASSFLGSFLITFFTDRCPAVQYPCESYRPDKAKFDTAAAFDHDGKQRMIGGSADRLSEPTDGNTELSNLFVGYQ